MSFIRRGRRIRPRGVEPGYRSMEQELPNIARRRAFTLDIGLDPVLAGGLGAQY